MKRKMITLLFWVGLLLVVLDIIFCRRMYYIPQAGIYVRQVSAENNIVENHFSRRILPLFLKRYKSLDVVRMNNLSEMGCQMMLDRGKRVLYLLDLPGSGDYNNFLSYTDNCLRIVVLSDWRMFYSDDDHLLVDTYTIIENVRRFALSFVVRPAHKVHLYYLLKPPVRK